MYLDINVSFYFSTTQYVIHLIRPSIFRISSLNPISNPDLDPNRGLDPNWQIHKRAKLDIITY